MVESPKPRLIPSVACLLGAIAIVAVAVVVWFFRSPIPRIDAAQAEELCAAADQLFAMFDERAYVNEFRWPKAISKLSPKSVQMTEDGIYLKLHSFFVMEEGLFLLPTNSKFSPTEGSDPSYRQLRERVYWYEIKG